VSAVLEAREPSARYLEAVQPALVRQFELVATAPGGVARLRELILTLAIQGKLVPQNSSEETALQLLETIAAEKERQIASGRIKPDKPLTAPLDHFPFEIPETWTWVPMGEVVEIVRGITFPASEKTKEAAPGRIACLRTANVQEAIEWDDLLFVSRSFMVRDDQLLKPHDIVMSMANSRELVGKVALVDHIPHPESTFGGFLGVLRPWKIDPRFAMALLRSSYVRSSLIDSSSQTTNIANISLGKLRPLPFPLPPLAEQARIVDRVDELMRLCDSLEAEGRLEAEQHARLLGTLLGTLTDSSTPEELAANWQRVDDHFDLLLDRPEAVDALEQTILQLAVRGLLVPQDSGEEPANLLLSEIHADRRRLLCSNAAKADKPSPPINVAEIRFALPPGWSWARLSEISNVIVDCPHSTAKFVDTGFLCLDTNSFKDGKLLPHKLRFVSQETFDKRIARLKPMPGDLVFAREGSVGQSIIIPEGIECCLGQRVMLFRLSQRVSNEFVRLAITTEDFLDALLSLHKGIGAKHVNVADMRNAVVPVPPFREQERILTRVTELRRLCADLRQRLVASRATQSHLADALVEQACA
jgi:type I restriction enzyme S subunit